jgi:predicted GNAT family acetyltransferase
VAAEIVDNPSAHRFEVAIDGELAELVYRLNGKRLVLVHTEVPNALEGHGLGGKLVRAALERAAREGLTIVPICPFAAKWLREHQNEIGAVAVDWPAPS